jgi:exonuclease SbcC
MLEGAVSEIEGFANSYLAEFTDGLSLEFRTQKETKSQTVRETLDILATDSLGTRDIGRFSGGERTRIDFAIAIGLSRFLSSISGGHVDSFCVDEPNALDDRGVEEMVRCLHILSRSVPFVLVVSHITGIAESMPQRVLVSKGANGSKVSVRSA